MDHSFEVGNTYRNRYGRYAVLAIDEPKMHVRYEDGREINLTLAIQKQILEGIQDAEAAAPKRARRKSGSTTKRGGTAGAAKADKREKLIAQILENDDAIFDLLAKKAIPPGQINTYRFFLKHPDEYISQKEFAEATGGSDRQSMHGVLMALGRRIGSSSDPRVRSLQPRNALIFDRKKSDGTTLYRIRQRVVQIFETYPQFHDFLINDTRHWLPDEFGSPHWEDTPAVHHAQLRYFGFWDRYEAERK